MPCAAYQWGAALNFKFDATFLHYNSPLRAASIGSSLREWVYHPFVQLLCLWLLLLLTIIKSFNQGILTTQSAQNKQKTQSDASTFQIICKVQRFLQNCTTTRGPLRYYCGEPNCRSHILQITCTDESERLLFSLISQRFVTKGSAVCTISIFIPLLKDSQQVTVERMLPPSWSLVSTTNRATGLSQLPCKHHREQVFRLTVAA